VNLAFMDVFKFHYKSTSVGLKSSIHNSYQLLEELDIFLKTIKDMFNTKLPSDTKWSKVLSVAIDLYTNLLNFINNSSFIEY